MDMVVLSSGNHLLGNLQPVKTPFHRRWRSTVSSLSVGSRRLGTTPSLILPSFGYSSAFGHLRGLRSHSLARAEEERRQARKVREATPRRAEAHCRRGPVTARRATRTMLPAAGCASLPATGSGNNPIRRARTASWSILYHLRCFQGLRPPHLSRCDPVGFRCSRCSLTRFRCSLPFRSRDRFESARPLLGNRTAAEEAQGVACSIL